MDTQPLDHSFHSADVPNLSSDLHTHQDFLSDPAIGVHHDPFDPSSIGVYEPNHVHSEFDSHNLADYQSYDSNSSLDHQYSQADYSYHLNHALDNQQLANYQSHDSNNLLDHQYSQVDHNAHLDHLSQRSGSANFTPSSPAEIVKNKEVIIKDEFGHDKSGTVTDKNSDGTYKVETSKEVYENVSYHDVQKYGSK